MDISLEEGSGRAALSVEVFEKMLANLAKEYRQLHIERDNFEQKVAELQTQSTRIGCSEEAHFVPLEDGPSKVMALQLNTSLQEGPAAKPLQSKAAAQEELSRAHYDCECDIRVGYEQDPRGSLLRPGPREAGTSICLIQHGEGTSSRCLIPLPEAGTSSRCLNQHVQIQEVPQDADDDISSRYRSSHTTDPQMSSKGSGQTVNLASTNMSNQFSSWFTVNMVSTNMSRGSAVLPSWFLETRSVAQRATPANALVDVLKKEEQVLQPQGDCAMISPISSHRLVWDALFLLVCFFDIWVMTVQWSLLALDCDRGPLNVFQTWGRVSTIFFSMDIILNLFTGFLRAGEIVMARRAAVVNYLRTYFVVDLLATFPFEELGRTGLGRVDDVAQLLRFIRLFRFGRVFRLGRFSERRRFLQANSFLSKLRQVSTHDAVETISSERWSADRKAYVKFAFGCLIVLAAHSHSVGCVRSKLSRVALSCTASLGAILQQYLEDFYWAFLTLMLGMSPAFQDGTANELHEIKLLESVVLFERILLMAFGMRCIVLYAISRSTEDRDLYTKEAKLLAYLNGHDVSIKTQLNCIQNISETIRMRKLCNDVQDMLRIDIPDSLCRRVRDEIWTPHLLSLGLIVHVGHHNSNFVTELAQVVVEEIYSSDVVLFEEGDRALGAYRVLSGEVAVSVANIKSPIPPFTAGTWLGEKALVKGNLSRSATCSTTKPTSLLNVPCDSFQELIELHGLRQYYEKLCVEHVFYGLCGRCGLLGDHFADECPSIAKMFLSRDLKTFIRDLKLDRKIEDEFKEMGILRLDELKKGETLEKVSKHLKSKGLIGPREQKLLTEKAICIYKNKAATSFKTMLTRIEDENAFSRHFMFLSHYKLEAGTEASLMRAELEHMLAEQKMGGQNSDKCGKRRSANTTAQGIFVDSEDLTTLEDLQRHVANSQNVCLLLTKGVLTRPWVLVEIVTACRHGIPVLPVNLCKLDATFDYPNDAFLDNLRGGADGGIVDASACRLLQEHGITLDEVAECVKSVFQRIAVPYSPHRPAVIRRAELSFLLKQAQTR